MRTLLLFLSLCCSLPAWGHDLWLESDGSDQVLLQGHRHSAHAGAETVPYDAATVVRAVCADTRGGQRDLTVGAVSPVRLSGPCAVLWVRVVSGYWTKTAWETKNVPRTGLSGVLRSWHAEESLKRIAQWSPSAAQPLGLGLEITPLSNPLSLKTSDKLRVRVTNDGRPLAGVPVAYGDDTRGVSGPDGEISIRLRRGGLQLIAASVEAPMNDGKADTSLRSTSLQFEVAR